MKVACFALVAVMAASVAHGQTPETPTAPPDPGLVAAAKRLLNAPTDEDSVPAFTIAFGGIKPGSGAALGPAVGHNFRSGGFLQATAEYSIRNFKLLQLRFQKLVRGHGRLLIRSRARWQDAPELPIYQLGVASPSGRAFYGERKTELNGELVVRVSPHVRLTGGAGFERYVTDGGRIDLSEDDALTFVPALAGLATRTWLLDSHIDATLDSRTVPGYDAPGWSAESALHSYRSITGGQFSFSQFHFAGERVVALRAVPGVVDASARLVLSSSGGATGVPFFLMPYLGGRDGLGGYRLYRFRDRDALVGGAEYRWPLDDYVDLAIFVEQGTVAHRARDLSRRFRADGGLGVRIHTSGSTLLLLDISRGGEGFQITVGM